MLGNLPLFVWYFVALNSESSYRLFIGGIMTDVPVLSLILSNTGATGRLLTGVGRVRYYTNKSLHLAVSLSVTSIVLSQNL